MGEPTPEEAARSSRSSTTAVGGRVLDPAVHPAADARLRAGRLPRRAGRVDRREVLGLDRLRRPPGERLHPRRAPRQRDAVLDPGTGASSGRLYWESFNDFGTKLAPVSVPVGVLVLPKEIIRASRRWAETRFSDIRHWTECDRGGHFAAFEQPELFVGDIRACFRALR